MNMIKPSPSRKLQPLTELEREVLHWLGEGFTIEDLVETLGMTHRTAEGHVESILRNFGVEDRASAVLERLRSESCALES